MRGQGTVATIAPGKSINAALPVVEVEVDGVRCSALVDTGCSQSILSASRCRAWNGQRIRLRTIDGVSQACCGIGTVTILTDGGVQAKVNVLVARGKPLGYDLLLGIDAIRALGGVTVSPGGNVEIGGGSVCAALHINEPDFNVLFDSTKRVWTAKWKWAQTDSTVKLKNKIAEYKVPVDVREEYEKELELWITNGWLIPYPQERLGPPKGLIPLMAVVQEQKQKVRPVLDYRELNGFVDAFTANAEVCAHKLRQWRRQGVDVSLMDLRKAYLQIHVDEELWPFQTVLFKGQRFCLTRLGFGLNVAPLIMKSVIDAIISQDHTLKHAVSAYVDDIFINENLVSAVHVRQHFSDFGLVCKDPVRLKDGARVLGLQVWEERGTLRWKRGNKIPEIPDVLTRRCVFSLCGKLVSHFPVCGWLRVAVAFLKRLVTAATRGWDDEIKNPSFGHILAEMLSRIREQDPVRGDWCMGSNEVTVWVDASSVATGVALEASGTVVEDACWLRPTNDSRHINLAELDAALKGVNLALQWEATTLHLVTDSACVHRWISDTLTGKARVNTRAAGEMLIRRRLGTLQALVKEYNLTMDVTLVRSCQNRADRLTRVPRRWLDLLKEGEPALESCAAVEDRMDREQVANIHCQSGHPGVKRTLYFARLVNPQVSKKEVKSVVKACETCQSIDPAPVRWRKGKLSTKDNWRRVAMDITHHNGENFLTLIDCGPSRFAVWRPLRRQDATSIIRQLESVFLERGPPMEVLTDNGTAFTSEEFRKFVNGWDVHLRFRCAHVPSGNGIIERNHRTIKTIAARKNCAVSEAVYWYNVTPKDNVSPSSAPADALHKYHVRVKGIEFNPLPELEVTEERFRKGDAVWVKNPRGKCTTRYGTGLITEVTSPQSVRVDGVPRHVKDLRLATRSQLPLADESESESDASEPALWCMPSLSGSDSDTSSISADTPIPDHQTENESTSGDEDFVVPLRRSTRRRRSPPPCPVCAHEIRGECRENHERVGLPLKRARVCAMCRRGREESWPC